MPFVNCGSCPACKYRTKNPKTDCKFGSKCTRKDCFFAHASPAGSAHMAGSVATACRSGILCSSAGCQFAHPSPSLACTAKVEVPPKLRLTGTLEYQKNCLGEYALTERQVCGRPVWKHASEDRYVAKSSNGNWVVVKKGEDAHNALPAVNSTSTSVYCVCDGHGGQVASRHAVTKLAPRLQELGID